MKRSAIFVALVFALVLAFHEASACGSHGCIGYPGYGAYFQGGWDGMYAPGAFGVMRPAWYGPIGRYPKRYFRAPLRRMFGLPGFTPVRQFLFGRGAERRACRRACLY
ncbi:MAG: hypothetical protein HY537_04560 [Deltaproteobacteria bacterium]|nr:hypothetical protein [Deltaproteobacteria bacterium]